MSSPAYVFAGTPDFALASLKALVESGRRPVAVYTQPDRPAGRGKRLAQSPVKRYALEHDIEVLQPKTLRSEDAVDTLTRLAPDMLVVAAYGLLLPQAILDVPRAGGLNVQASLLPRWRGAAPIQASILAGDAETGISLMAMEAGLDTGPVFVDRAIAIGARETAGSLHDRLASLGGEVLVAHIDEIASGRIEATAQDDSKASYAPKITTDDARLDWTKSAAELDRCVRAFNPVPGSFFIANGERMKCWAARPLEGKHAAPGEVVDVSEDGIVVACSDGALKMEVLQRPGRGRVNAREFTQSVNLSGARLR